ncbi:hypothetical protein KCU67_g6271, partial [Aureobasidium melanogenum]
MVTVLRHARDQYEQLCAAFGTGPTDAQVKEIKSAVGPISVFASRYLEYALLYFLPKSNAVLENNTLLTGWVHEADGSKKELWFKPGTRSEVYFQCGGPPGSRYRTPRQERLCDEWHPSIKAICSSIKKRDVLYIYLAAIMKLIQASPQPPSVEDSVEADEDASSMQVDSPGLSDFEHSADNGSKKSTGMKRARRVVNSGELSDNDCAGSNIRTGFTWAEYTKKARLSFSTSKSSTVDLTAYDVDDAVKVEHDTAQVASRHDAHQTTTSAKQELLLMLQSKKASEIEDMLAKRSGQLPDWIERVMREEMEKKMVRDLEMVRNLF